MLVVAATFLWPLLKPTRVVPTAQIEVATSAGPSTVAMAEAAGWVEPDPFPILVRPLVAGRVEQIPMDDDGLRIDLVEEALTRPAAEGRPPKLL